MFASLPYGRPNLPYGRTNPFVFKICMHKHVRSASRSECKKIKANELPYATLKAHMQVSAHTNAWAEPLVTEICAQATTMDTFIEQIMVLKVEVDNVDKVQAISYAYTLMPGRAHHVHVYICLE